MIIEQTTDQQQEIKTEYRIDAANIDYLDARFKRLAIRARRIGCAAPTYEVIGTEHYRDEKTKRISCIYTIKLIGERPIIAGYRFLGTLEHNAEIGTIIRAVPGLSIPPQYREADPTNCDQCHKHIVTRSETFIVEHIESGAFKQVGRTCVADFLGGADPQAILAMVEMFEQAGDILDIAERDDDEEIGHRVRQRYTFDTIDVMAATSAVYRNIGWTPRSKAEILMRPATADQIACWLTWGEEMFKDQKTGLIDRDEMAKYISDDRDKQIAEAALDWARELPRTAANLSDYLYNLSVMAKAASLETKHFGLACSIIPAYNREQERLLGIEREKQQGKTRSYFGEIKKREDFTLTVTRHSTTEGSYGVTHIYGFEDQSGNRAVWFASNDPDLALGHTYQVKATVTKHEEYQGIPQTTLTRIKVIKNVYQGKTNEKTIAI